MACNCGRRRIIRQDPGPGPGANTIQQTAETLVASTQVAEIDMTTNQTDPATGTLPAHNGSHL